MLRLAPGATRLAVVIGVGLMVSGLRSQRLGRPADSWGPSWCRRPCALDGLDIPLRMSGPLRLITAGDIRDVYPDILACDVDPEAG